MSKQEKKEVNNPNLYGYKYDQEVTVKGGLLNEMFRLISPVLDKETNVDYEQTTRWVDKEGNPYSGDINPETIKEKGLTQNIDIESIFGQGVEPTVSYTKLGRELLRLQILLFETKNEHIDKGVALHVDELREGGKMSVVD